MTQIHNRETRVPAKLLKNTLLLITAGIGLNLLLSWICVLTGCPLYLDSVGTILVSFFGGLFPGVVVGYLTNLLKSFFDGEAIYYSAVNVLIALVASGLYRRKWFRSWGKALLSVPVFSLFGGVFGSLLTLMLYGFHIADTFAGSLAQRFWDAGLQNVALAQMAGDTVVDLADKLVSVLFAVVVFRSLPANVRDWFRTRLWLQNSLSREDYKEAGKLNRKGFSLRKRIVLLISISVIVISAVTTGVSYYYFHDTTFNAQEEMARGVTHVVMGSFDPERVDEYLTLGKDAPGYMESEAAMNEIRNSSSNIAYVYVYKILEDGCHVVFDPDTPETEGAAPGSVLPFDEGFLSKKDKLLAGEEIPRMITDDTYGWLLSVYTPVKNSAGETVCYACADISMESLRDEDARFLARNLSLFIGLAVLILAGFLWYAENGIILPINTMALFSAGFAFNSEEERVESVEQLRSLGIHTGDEIENLYRAIIKTTDDSVRYIAESQEKNEIISRMQENLIITMADLVESRDQNTGDHIKNTSEYTRIIMNELRKEGHYTDLLTDEFMADVFRSAPLHDIGKIRISDTILNKPGKLTDEEFALMKLHTVYGGEVIEKTRSASADISYLNVAKDLATYHHEWWNGRGYPEGLKGEKIPLSARIMAVADVFDALVSRRCYKDGFSFEKSMDIIREESGTHFDPLVAGAFLNARDEVRKVLEERQQGIPS